MTNRRFVHKTIEPMTWRELYVLLRYKLFGYPNDTRYEEVEEFLACGCKNPEYEKATHEETIIWSANSPHCFKLYNETKASGTELDRRTTQCRSDGKLYFWL